MSKGLEALEKLYCAGRLDLDYVGSDEHKNDYNIIEKELEALEIIKEKRVDVDLLMDCSPYDGYRHTTGLIEYNNSTTITQKELTQEEYDILKEVLL